MFWPWNSPLFFLRRKLSVRIQELEDLLEQTRLRCSNLERTKSKLTAELKEVTIELENVSKKKIVSRELYTWTCQLLKFLSSWLNKTSVILYQFDYYFSVKSSSKTSPRGTDSWRMKMLLSRRDVTSCPLRMPNSATTNTPLNRRCTDSRSPMPSWPRRTPTSREKTRTFLVHTLSLSLSQPYWKIIYILSTECEPTETNLESFYSWFH